MDAGEAGDERRAVARLELVEAAAVDDARDHLADVVGRADVGRQDAEDLLGVVLRRLRLRDVEGRERGTIEGLDDRARDAERLRVVLREVVGDARHARVDVGAAELLRRDDLAGRGLHERRPREEDRPVPLDDHRLVAHRGDVRAARGARPHHDRDLWNPRRREHGLVPEDPPEVVLVGEDVGLERQERAARVDQVDGREPVLERDLLGADVLLDGQGVVGPALDRRVVRHDDHASAVDEADACDDSGRGDVVPVHALRRKRRELEERAPLVEETVDALAREELSTLLVLGPGLLGPALADAREHPLERCAEGPVVVAVPSEPVRGRVDPGRKDVHRASARGSGPRGGIVSRPSPIPTYALDPFGPARI